MTVSLPLNSLYINPTRFCNLSCSHCWLSPPHKDELKEANGELSMKEIIDIVKEAVKLGLNCVKLTGGEPLLRKDIGKLLQFTAASKISVDIETNGTLITKDMARMLREFKVNFISVSLDSYSSRAHDAFRGKKGAFRRAVDGIVNLKDEGFSPQVIISLYRGNLDNFDKFIKFMKELGVTDVKINTISSLGRGAVLLNDGKAPSVKEVLEFAKDLKGRAADFKGSLYLDIPLAFKDIEEIKYKGGRKCAIKNILGLLSDGSVSICGIGIMDKDLNFGNIRKDPSRIRDIWRKNKVLKMIREDLPSKLEGVCGICVFKNMCLGNCRAEAYHNKGSLFEASWFCQEAYDTGLFPATRLVPDELRKKII